MTKRNRDEAKEMSILQVLREAAGLTQAALAKQIPDKTGQKSLTQQAISNWERGLDEPELTIAQVKALCRALGRGIEDLPENFARPSRKNTPGE